MRENNFENKQIVKDIANEVWRCLDSIRSSIIDDNFHVILFIISAFKDGFFHRKIGAKTSDILNQFRAKIKHDSYYSKLEEIYHPVLSNINLSSFDELFYHLSHINRSELEFNFPDIFEYLLKRIIDIQGKRSGEFVQPEEISRLIIKLADLHPNAKVYNPFAGLASFGMYLQENQEYFGQEINKTTWAIGQMRLNAHQKGHRYRYELGDSIENWQGFQKYDLIVASPPFKVAIQRHFHSQLTGEPYGTVENFLVEEGIHSLKDNGQLIAMFSLSFLFRGGRLGRLKKWLIQNDLIDTVISLPSGLLSNSNVSVCIVVFKTISRRPGYVRLVDASTFFTTDGPRNKFLKDEEIYKLISDDLENEFLRDVSNSEITENDFDLSVGRYFLKDIKGAPLSNFTEIVNGPKAPLNARMRQVQIRNLKDDVFDSVLKSNEIDLNFIERTTFRVIEESCLLLATRWSTLKPTYFEYTGEPIVISQAIVALKLNKEIVDPTFLINEFSADYIKEQIDGYRIGAVQPMLRMKDLKNIIFEIPSMQEQRAKVSGIIELSSRLKELEADKENLLSGFKKEETESSTSLSHILGKPLLSIGSSLEIIQSTLSKLDPKWKEIMISDNRQFKMSDAFESISKNVKYIQELVDENTSLVSVSSFDLTEVRFLRFLSEFIKSEKKSLNNNIELKLDVHEDIREQMDNQVLIKGNEQKLRIVLINLIDNAKNHAFKNNGKENKINIEILPFTGNELEASYLNYDIDGRKSYVEVKVSNTGKPFPKDITLDDYVRKNFAVGKTRNRGLGGYEVNEILKVHNEGKNALNLSSSDENQKYSTTVSFIIPVI